MGATLHRLAAAADVDQIADPDQIGQRENILISRSGIRRDANTLSAERQHALHGAVAAPAAHNHHVTST
jgi:hypothetical protein